MAPNNTDTKLKSLKPHPEFFIRGGDLTIIIDDTSFCVFGYFFTRESSVFRERLGAQTSLDSTKPSKMHETIVIQPSENVTPDDFAKLCWVFYNKKLSIYDAPLETWETILRLANQYKFPEVKDLAFRELEAPGKFTFTPVQRIVLYRKYEADRKYLEGLYVELLSRPEPLSLEEGKALGLTSTLLISGARERLRASSDRLTLSDPLPESMRNIVKEMVVSVFWGGPAPDLSRLSNGSPGDKKVGKK